jgi:nucleoside-diphosphate-sugar epimerase
MKNILVVGGAGYIGGALTDRLMDYNLRVYDNLLYDNIYRKPVDFVFGDIRDTSKLKKQLEWADAVIWLSAIVGDPACNLNQDLTVDINERSVKWLCDNYDGRIIFISTCSVYGFNDKLLDEESKLNPLSLYAWTKLNSEKYLEEKNAIIFRLGTVYGLGDIYSRLRMDLVVNILTAHAQKLNKITVYGGEQHRPLIHVKDIALAIEKVVDSDLTGVFNLHSLNTTVVNIADSVKKHFSNLIIETTGVKFQDNRSYRVSSEKAHKQFNFKPIYTLDDGIIEIKQLLESGRIKDVFGSNYSNVEHLKSFGDKLC